MLRFFALNRGSLKILALAGLLALAPAIAEARMGGGGSFGSRGARTWSAPPSTRTMPGTASPFERSVTPRPSQNMNGGFGAQPGFAGSSFGRSFMGGLAGGLLGAGLFGLLMGHGFFGGIGGFMSIIGLLMQAALIFFLARLAFSWFANRNAAGRTNTGAPLMNPFNGGAPFGGAQPRAGASGFGGWNGARPTQTTPIVPTADDFNQFERLLGDLQGAYSKEDLGALRMMTTPEMSSYFDDEFEENRRRGQINRISNVKLVQGDLSEAWREGGEEYATVAMRFKLTDIMEDRNSGERLPHSQGDGEVTEAWTFKRDVGSGVQGWKLSAIQQQQ
jgi:predicted lipid-binding transport protein (Tim44 family)